MLTQNGKNYIANTFGIGGCFAASGLSWSYLGTDNVTYNESGATAQIVSRLVMTSLVQSVTYNGRVYIYSAIRNANDGSDITLDDTRWIAGNDGSPSGEPRFCASAQTPTPAPTYGSSPTPRPITPTPTPAPTLPPGPTPQPTPAVQPTQLPGAPGQYEFQAPPSGSPSVNLDLNELTMQQNNTDYHFEMNDVLVTNTSQWRVYIACEVRLFTGALNYCPSSGWIFDGMNRVSTSRATRITVLDPGEVARLNLDFYQPLSIEGLHTVCLLVHGTFSRSELVSEISGISG